MNPQSRAARCASTFEVSNSKLVTQHGLQAPCLPDPNPVDHTTASHCLESTFQLNLPESTRQPKQQQVRQDLNNSKATHDTPMQELSSMHANMITSGVPGDSQSHKVYETRP
jgi:hypothetical protein